MSSSGTQNPRYESMVIGYGNSLRRDDGAGRRVAEAVASWQLPGVAVRSIHQLLPELVEDLIKSARVIFVDSTAYEQDVQVRRFDASQGLVSLHHTCDPGCLLALANALYGRCPEGWLLTVPGTDFSIGEEISTRTEKNIATALTHVRDLLRRPFPTT